MTLCIKWGNSREAIIIQLFVWRYLWAGFYLSTWVLRVRRHQHIHWMIFKIISLSPIIFYHGGWGGFQPVHINKMTKSTPGGIGKRVAVLGWKQLAVLATPTYWIVKTQGQVSGLNVSSEKRDYTQMFSLLSFSILYIKYAQFSSKKSKIQVLSGQFQPSPYEPSFPSSPFLLVMMNALQATLHPNQHLHNLYYLCDCSMRGLYIS